MKILLVGAGGYGTEYVKRLLNSANTSLVFEGIADPYYSSAPMKNEIDKAHIPVYNTMDEFYSEHDADLAIICTPPFLHKEQSLCALNHGSYVLCEKPVAPTVEEARIMEEAQEKYGKWIAIGYQWSFSKAIRELKKDILNGKLGKAISFKTLISWPRNRAYYARGAGWGGKLIFGGKVLLDSIASNACAHYLHNMLFILGDSMETSSEVTELTGNCLRANEIENFDTCSLKLRTNDGTELFYIASHAAEKPINPKFEYKFEKATVYFSEDDGSMIKAHFSDGSTKDYGNPFADPFEKIDMCAKAIIDGKMPICTVRTATPHTKLIERIWKELQIVSFPSYIIREKDGFGGVYADGLFEAMVKAYAECKLLSDTNTELFKQEREQNHDKQKV